MTFNLSTMTKADLNAMLPTPLTASALKKTAHDALCKLVLDASMQEVVSQMRRSESNHFGIDPDAEPEPTPTPTTPEPTPKADSAPKASPAPKTPRVLDDRIVQQPATDLKHVKPINEGTKKHLIAQALLTGATVEKLQEVTGWNRATALSSLTVDMRASGLGVERKAGVYYLIMPAGVKAIPVRAKDMTRADALVAACK